MSFKKAFWLIILALGLMVLAGYRFVPSIKVTNQCGQDIDRLTVEVSGQSLAYGGLAEGESAKRSLLITRDSSFMLTYQLADGSSARWPVGHIDAPAWWSRIHISIGSGGALDIRYD